MTPRILRPALRLAANNTMRQRAEPHPRTAAADLEWNADATGERRLLTDEELASIMPVHDFAPVAKIEPRIWDEAFGPEDEEQRGGGPILVLFCGVCIVIAGLIGVALRWGWGL